MSIKPASVGPLEVGLFSETVSPQLPPGRMYGDMLVCFSLARTTAGTLASSWTEQSFTDLGNFYIRVSYQVASPTTVAPVLTPTGMTSGQKHIHRIVAFRGIDISSPFGTPGTGTQNAVGANIGPCTAATASAPVGAVVVFGGRNANWTSTDILTGDSLIWENIFSDGLAAQGNDLSFVLDFASWNTTAPTLTAKTFTVNGGIATEVGCSQMFLLNALTNVQVPGVSAVEWQDLGKTLSPGLPSGIQGGDLLLCFSMARTVGDVLQSSWPSLLIQDFSSFYLDVSYRIALGNGLDTPPTIISTNVAFPHSTAGAVILAIRGVDVSSIRGLFGAAANPGAQATTIGPIAAPAVMPDRGILFVIGSKLAVWTGVALLTGDSMTWVEAVDSSYDPAGTDQGLVIDYTVWQNSTPTITAKTFTTTGGVSNVTCGIMLVMDADGIDDPLVNFSTISKMKPVQKHRNQPKIISFYPGDDPNPDLSSDFDCKGPPVRPAFRYRFPGIIQPCGYPSLDQPFDISGDFWTAKVRPMHHPIRFLSAIIPITDTINDQAEFSSSDFEMHPTVAPMRTFKSKLFKPIIPRTISSVDVNVDLSSEKSYNAIVYPKRRIKQKRRRYEFHQLTELDTQIVGNLNAPMGEFIANLSMSLSIVGNLIAVMDDFTLATYIETWMDIHPDDDIWTPLSF